MSARKVLVDLGKVVTRVSHKNKPVRPTLERLFSSEKSDGKSKSNDHAVNAGEDLSARFCNEPSQAWTNPNRPTSLSGELSREELVIKNMKEGRFSTRSIDSSPNTISLCGAAGSDLLITRISERERFGSWDSDAFKVVGTALVNVESGSSQKLGLNDAGQSFSTPSSLGALLTPSYYVTMDGYSLVRIQNRSTGAIKTVALPIQTEARSWDEAMLVSNNILGCEKVLVCRQFTTKIRHWFLVDLERGDFHQIPLPVIWRNDQRVDVQLCGSLIVYHTYGAANNAPPWEITVRVIDATGKEIFRKEKLPPTTAYFLQEDKIIVADINAPTATWSAMDLAGNVLKTGSFPLPQESPREWPSVSVHKNFLVFSQSKVLYFVDYNSGELLTSLSSHSQYSYGHVYGVGAGKFVVSDWKSIQLVDFESESAQIEQPVRVVVINPNDTVSTRIGALSEMINGISFSNQLDPFHKAVPMSTILHLTDKERITFVHNRPSWAKPSPIVSRLLKKKNQMVNSTLRSVPKGSITKFLGQGLLFKEDFVDGQWRPVNFDVKQAEEFINQM